MRPLAILRRLCAVALTGLALPCATQAATQQHCTAAFDAYRLGLAAAGVADKHLPFMILQPDSRTDTAVLLIHGLYESPYFLRGAASRFAAAGYNVVSLLLPGHWDAGWRSIDTVTYRDWLATADFGLDVAHCVGQHVIVAGHSLGGTLALYTALARPRDVDALVLWAPATELRALPTLGGVIGKASGIAGNTFTRKRADADESARLSGNPVFQLYEMIQYLGRTYGDAIPLDNGKRRDLPLSYVRLGAQVRAPVFAIVPLRDPAVDARETLSLLAQMPQISELIVYPEESAVWHANVAKSSMDTYRSQPGDYNPSFDWMMDRILAFTARVAPANRAMSAER
ncbi:alpha/beta hydrolase [Burkholderia singularis]|uniref:Lysophospholipase n=1 Tax=Burkholderia singularis TaxID=1503053 RepID=A0A238GYZ8_9BURK|nr:alpha/beta fold hydrolase [Burkholderia singularis]SMF98163.1 Lysophospholipase [Burkholderia singularis]